MLEFLPSQPASQQLGDLRASHSHILRQYPSCPLRSLARLEVQVGGRISGAQFGLYPLAYPTVSQFLGDEASVSHCHQPPPPGTPWSWNEAIGSLGTPVLLPTTDVAARLLPPLAVELDLLRIPLGPHTRAHTSFSSSCASRSSISAVALCTASEPSMVPSIASLCRPQGLGGFISQDTHPHPARRLCHELTGPILHLPPPPVTFTPGSPRELGEAGTVCPPTSWPIRAEGPSAPRTGLQEGACLASVLSAWVQLGLSQGGWAAQRTHWRPLTLLTVPPAGRLETAQPVPMRGTESQLWGPNRGLCLQLSCEQALLALQWGRLCWVWAGVSRWWAGLRAGASLFAHSSCRPLPLQGPTAPPSEALLYVAACPLTSDKP